jgi:hypothetical protein
MVQFSQVKEEIMTIQKQELDDKTIEEIWGPKAVDAKDQEDPKKEDPIKDEADPDKADPDKGDPTKDPIEPKTKDEAQQVIDDIMEEHGFEDLDDLVEAVASTKEVAKKLGTRKLDDLIKAAETLEKLDQQYIDQEEGETDEAKEIARLKRENQALKAEKESDQETQNAREQALAGLKAHENLVASILEGQEIPVEHTDFLKTFLGVNSPVLDVDLDNKVAAKKIIRGMVKQYNDFVGTVIKSYTEGKVKIPDITPIDTTPESKGKVISSLKDARRVTAEILSGKFNR